MSDVGTAEEEIHRSVRAALHELVKEKLGVFMKSAGPNLPRAKFNPILGGKPLSDRPDISHRLLTNSPEDSPARSQPKIEMAHSIDWKIIPGKGDMLTWSRVVAAFGRSSILIDETARALCESRKILSESRKLVERSRELMKRSKQHEVSAATANVPAAAANLFLHTSTASTAKHGHRV